MSRQRKQPRSIFRCRTGRAPSKQQLSTFEADLKARFKPGDRVMMNVRHDHDCPMLHGGPCTCRSVDVELTSPADRIKGSRPAFITPAPIDRSLPRRERTAAITAAGEAMAETIRESKEDSQGKNAVLMGPRAGTLEIAPPRSLAELTSCCMCGHPVWITTAIREAIEAKGMKCRALCVQDCDWRPNY
jgi:hypothetical protein